MTLAKPPIPGATEAQSHHVRQLAVIMLIVTVPTFGFYTFLALRTGTWQMAVAAGAVGLYVIGVLVSLRLNNRGNVYQAADTLIHGIAAAFLVFTLVVAGFGGLLSLAIVLLAITISTQTLPANRARTAILVSIGLSLANLILDAILPPYRVTLPELQAYIPIALGLLVVVYVVFFVRQFNTFQFSTKLLVVLLVASLIPVFGLGLYANQTARLELENAASTALATRADLQSAIIGETLIKEAELLQTLALNDIIEEAAVTATNETPLRWQTFKPACRPRTTPGVRR